MIVFFLLLLLLRLSLSDEGKEQLFNIIFCMGHAS